MVCDVSSTLLRQASFGLVGARRAVSMGFTVGAGELVGHLNGMLVVVVVVGWGAYDGLDVALFKVAVLRLGSPCKMATREALSSAVAGFRAPHPELCSLDHSQWDGNRINIKWFE